MLCRNVNSIKMLANKSNNLCHDQCEEHTPTYHPCGMLDRDQRTAKSLPEFSKIGSESYSVQKCSQSKNKCCYNKTLLNSNVNAIKSVKQHRLQQNGSVLLFYNCSNNNVVVNSNTNQSDSSRKKNNNLIYCQLSSLSNYEHSFDTCDQVSLLNNCKWQKQKQQQKQRSPVTCTKSSSKFSNLLICICFWLLLLQKTRAMPVTKSCETYKDAIKLILDQAKMSYKDNLLVFNEFTRKYFQENHEALHEGWKHVRIDSLKPRTSTDRRKEPQFYDKTENEVVAHLQGVFSKAMVHKELQELYERLLILEHAFNYITDRNNVIDDYDSRYYDTHLNYLKMLKEETSDSLDKLNIDRPQFQEPNLSMDSKELRDYFVMREHMIILKYIIDAYDILRSTCPTDE